METTAPTRRRNRSKSIGQKVADDSTETAPNLNGNKDGVEEESVTEKAPDVKTQTPEKEPPPKPTQGRKRKASEMKSESSGGEEPPPEKETKEVIEPEKKDELPEETTEEIAPLEDKPDEKPSDDMSVPQKQQFGKGKRARIPNKRYSDIVITSPKHEKPKRIENGENQSVDITEKENSLLESTDVNSPALAAIKANRLSAGSPSGHSAKKQKIQIDLTNPNFLKPFHYGWKRELVYRATSDNSIKRNGDIYYYTPSGKKVRSMREVSENLKNKELTLDDFTFYKEPLGLDDPEKEIIRDAKLKTGPRDFPTKPPKTPKASSPKPSTPSSGGSTESTQSKARSSPKATSGTGFKVKLPNKNQASKAKSDKKNKDDGDMEVGTYPPNWSSPAKRSTKWSNNLNEEDKQQPCSIRCENVWKPIPSLQCRYCLCLYHNECVGLAPHAIIDAYVCKNCQLRQLPSTGSAILPPPPLTPISSMKPSVATAPASLPKLQRIPKSQQDSSKSQTGVAKADLEMPKLTPRPGLTTVPKYVKAPEAGTQESKSLLGSVTTWFPPSSTIQVGNGSQRNDDSVETQPHPRPQIVEYLGQKKFLIVPKHNVLSVSPPISGGNRSGEELVSTPYTFGDEARESPAEAAKIPEAPEVKEEPPSPRTISDPALPMEIDTGKETEGIEKVVDEQTGENTVDSEASKSPPLKATPKTSLKAKRRTSFDDKALDTKFMENYMQNLAYGYGTLLYVFQYLKVQDLLRAGCVCTMWRDVANHPVLWRTVRMKNSQIHSFDGLADTLQKHGTVHLDLRKMLLPSGGGDELWPQFSEAIKKVDSLRRLELCRCPAAVVEQLAVSNPKLEVINALAIKCENLSLEPLTNAVNLLELKLKATNGLMLTSDLTALRELQHLKSLSLTSIKELQKLNLDVIAELNNLESLELGECTDLPNTFGSGILSKLDKLEKLRLEKGQGTCYTFEILEAVRNMPRLEQLELVNFDIKAGFDKALGSCTNIKKLLIIPTYISQSATTNHMVLGGVLRLQNTLSHFVWGVTLELLRVTELFVDQCEDSEKKEKKDKKPVGNGDSIPVLKPVPLLGDKSDPPPQTSEPPQVEILPLPNLQKLLLANLPSTRVKILKIPFHATWRQTISDSTS